MLKKSFTLFELIISILLISIVYIFAINSFPKFVENKNTDTSIENLKEDLFSFEFEDTVSIKCIEDDLQCFVFLDDVIQKQKLNAFFDTNPTVYEYNNKLNIVEFEPLELEQLQSYNIVFEFTCKKNGKCDEYIIETDNKVYIFSNLNNKVDTIKYISDIDQYFDKKIQEVKDAF